MSRPAENQPGSRADGNDSGIGVDTLIPQITEVFQRRLDAAQFGPDDDFFRHGGSSFLAALCTADLRKRGVALSIQDLFLAPSARALAARVQPLQKAR